MQDRAGSQLRELFRGKVAAASELAVREQGNVPADLVKDLSSLKQLIELNDSATPPSSKKHWVLPVMLITTLVIMSALLFVRLPDALVDLEVTTSKVAFTLDQSQVLASNIRVFSISASGLRSIDASGFNAPEHSGDSQIDGSDSVRLSLAGDEKGSITLDKIQLPANTRVTLETLEGTNRFRVAWSLPKDSSQQKPEPLDISAQGEIQWGRGTMPVQVSNLIAPGGLEVVPDSDVVLELDLLANSELATEPQLLISRLSFATVLESVGLERSDARQVSTIRSGTLFIQSLNGQKYDLRTGERLQFSRSKGELRKVTLGRNGINVQYEGKVWGMSAGSRDFPNSLMPSLLEWLRARHGLSLLWGSTLYLAGMLTVVLRWFRMID